MRTRSATKLRALCADSTKPRRILPGMTRPVPTDGTHPDVQCAVGSRSRAALGHRWSALDPAASLAPVWQQWSTHSGNWHGIGNRQGITTVASGQMASKESQPCRALHRASAPCVASGMHPAPKCRSLLTSDVPMPMRNPSRAVGSVPVGAQHSRSWARRSGWYHPRGNSIAPPGARTLCRSMTRSLQRCFFTTNWFPIPSPCGMSRSCHSRLLGERASQAAWLCLSDAVSLIATLVDGLFEIPADAIPIAAATTAWSLVTCASTAGHSRQAQQGESLKVECTR